MYLYRQVILCVNKLYKYGEILESAAGCTECILVFRYILGKRLAFVLAVCNNALTVLMAGQLPALSYLICV